jgi:hypothetical protein
MRTGGGSEGNFPDYHIVIIDVLMTERVVRDVRVCIDEIVEQNSRKECRLVLHGIHRVQNRVGQQQ